MSTGQLDDADEANLLALMESEPCQWCDEGTLACDEYKDTAALVCEVCETPAIRVW